METAMSKKRFYFFCLTVIIPAVILYFSFATGAEKKIYYLGTYQSVKGNDQSAGGILQLFKEIQIIYEKRNHILIELKIYDDMSVVAKDLRNKKIDFFLPGEKEILHDMIKKYKMIPFLSGSTFNMDHDKHCLFVKNSSPYKSLHDTEGKKLQAVQASDLYYSLRLIIKKNPLEYFENIRFAKNPTSLFYSLALDQCDVIMVNYHQLIYMKKTNPGPVKDIRELACSEAFPNAPLMHTKAVPEKVLTDFETFLINMRKDKELKKYWPLMKSFDYRVYKVTAKDYEPVFRLIEEARKKGWDKEYKTLLKFSGRQ